MAIAGLSFIRLNTKIGALFLWKSAARTDKKTALPYGRAQPVEKGPAKAGLFGCKMVK